ncbi:hypothetical protein [Allokutzneria sp. NRRL B-24872]|uniref:hypothetical protein n=1 Tax=Allokutzneria sp. NRRL B-24872 TaxID=1137961 RepID=UPI000A393FF7|nr:hypothetical protein [Allokutzneria sp. NRRL B-24872]
MTTTEIRPAAPLVGAASFLALYLSVDFATSPLREGDMPLPGAPVPEVYEFLVNNSASSIVGGILQFASVIGFLLFFRRVSTKPLGAFAGWTAVVSMVLTAVLMIVLGSFAPSLSPELASTVRGISFTLGGVVHVVALGVFLLVEVARAGGWTKAVRVTAWVGAVPAMLSISSTVWFMASILLPLGRVLSMIALVTAGVSLLRGRGVRA